MEFEEENGEKEDALLLRRRQKGETKAEANEEETGRETVKKKVKERPKALWKYNQNQL
jgi:hypothetical protein